MGNKICAIHQPNFFPWLGYFDKIKKSDKFVILDDINCSNTTNFVSRVSINFAGKSKWVSAPINHDTRLHKINQATFQKVNWRDKFIKTLQINYAKAPYFKLYKNLIFDLIEFKEDNIAKYNLNAIQAICNILGINIYDKIILSSKYNLLSKSNQLLIDLTKKANCNIYMAGGGSNGYQDIKLFTEQNIDFIYQNFKHPTYNQVKTKIFVDGLSVIDYIFCSHNLESKKNG